MSWLTGWNRRKQITVTGSTSGALSDYQMKLTVNQGNGTDSTGVVYLGGNILSNFNDLRFTKSDGITELNYWIESITGTTPNQTATVWIKLAPSPDTIPVSPGIYNFYIYYNNTGATATSSGTNTFIQWHGTSNIAYYDPNVIDPTSFVYEAYVNHYATGMSLAYNGVNEANNKTEFYSNTKNYIYIDNYSTDRLYSGNGTASGFFADSNAFTNTYHRLKIVKTATTANGYIDEISRWSTITTNLPNTTLGLFLEFDNGGYGTSYWAFARKYVATEPTFSSIGTEEVFALPANITATNITINPSESPCRQGICTIEVSVTWTNNGGISETFVPNISIDGTPASPIYSSESLGPGANVTHGFSVSGLYTGTHTICPDPN